MLWLPFLFDSTCYLVTTILEYSMSVLERNLSTDSKHVYPGKQDPMLDDEESSEIWGWMERKQYANGFKQLSNSP